MLLPSPTPSSHAHTHYQVKIENFTETSLLYLIIKIYVPLVFKKKYIPNISNVLI